MTTNDNGRRSVETRGPAQLSTRSLPIGTSGYDSTGEEMIPVPAAVVELCQVIPTEPLTAVDLRWWLDEATASFGMDYYNQQGVEYMKAAKVFTVAQSQKYSPVEFRNRVSKFCLSQKYPNWTVASFFEEERTRLYNYQWMCERKHEFNAGLIGGYIVPGYDKPLWGYVDEIGDALEREC